MRSTGSERAAESQTGSAPVFEMGMIGRRGRFFAPFGRSFARERHQIHLFSDTHRR